MNKVIRQCERCSYKNEDSGFTYLGDSVWACPNCLSKYTHIVEILEDKDG